MDRKPSDSVIEVVQAHAIREAVEAFKMAFDAMVAFEALPVRYERSRDGWAGYKGDRRISKFYFSQESAQREVDAQ